MTRGGGTQSNLSRREALALALIRERAVQGFLPPSLDDIRKKLKLPTKSGAQSIVASLRRRGIIARTGRPRAHTSIKSIQIKRAAP
jgi:SOS-response transcriptional repressor LexA